MPPVREMLVRLDFAERVEELPKHERESCWGCHKQMDPTCRGMDPFSVAH